MSIRSSAAAITPVTADDDDDDDDDGAASGRNAIVFNATTSSGDTDDDDDSIECIKVTHGGRSCGGNRHSRSKTAVKKEQLLAATMKTTTASATMMPDSDQRPEDPPSNNDDDTGTRMIEQNKLLNRGDTDGMSSNHEENISNASKTKRKRQKNRTTKTRKHAKKKNKKKNPPVVVRTTASSREEENDDDDTVAEGNKEYINYRIRRLFNDGNYYIGTVVTSIAPQLTDDNVLVRTVAYADGDKDIVDEQELREWKYTTDDDDDDDNDNDDDAADSSRDDDATVAEGNRKKAGAATSIIDLLSSDEDEEDTKQSTKVSEKVANGNNHNKDGGYKRKTIGTNKIDTEQHATINTNSGLSMSEWINEEIVAPADDSNNEEDISEMTSPTSGSSCSSTHHNTISEYEKQHLRSKEKNKEKIRELGFGPITNGNNNVVNIDDTVQEKHANAKIQKKKTCIVSSKRKSRASARKKLNSDRGNTKDTKNSRIALLRLHRQSNIEVKKGLQFRKEFSHIGTVISKESQLIYDEEENEDLIHWKVKYDDGDIEDILESELKKHVQKTATEYLKEMDDELSNTAVDSRDQNNHTYTGDPTAVENYKLAKQDLIRRLGLSEEEVVTALDTMTVPYCLNTAVKKIMDARDDKDTSHSLLPLGRKLYAVEVFCGCAIVSNEFVHRKWRVRALDNDPNSRATHQVDFMNFTWASIMNVPDFIWLSPPCFTYSKLAGGKHRDCNNGNYSKTPEAREHDRMLSRILWMLKFMIKKKPHMIIMIEVSAYVYSLNCEKFVSLRLTISFILILI